MRLQQWLDKMNITQKDFAEISGISRQYLSKIINGHIIPGKSVALIIEKMTCKEVTAREILVPDVKQDKD